jgi:hypothetical protein
VKPRRAHHKGPPRVRPGEEVRHRKARLERAGQRPCRWCGFVVYARGTDAHPQCALEREESRCPAEVANHRR